MSTWKQSKSTKKKRKIRIKKLIENISKHNLKFSRHNNNVMPLDARRKLTNAADRYYWARISGSGCLKKGEVGRQRGFSRKKLCEKHCNTLWNGKKGILRYCENVCDSQREICILRIWTLIKIILVKKPSL